MRVKVDKRVLAAAVIRLVVITTGITVCSGQRYLRYNPSTSGYPWGNAKSFFECSGHLAVQDSEEKQMALLNQVNIRFGQCAWIGAATLNTESRYRWIEVPPNYSELSANGELLIQTYSNFPQGTPVVEENRAVCIYSNGTWGNAPTRTGADFICELTECGPGFYKGRVPSDQHCVSTGEETREACVPCLDGTIKSVSGDDPALCLDACDGTTNVPNAERTACVPVAGYDNPLDGSRSELRKSGFYDLKERDAEIGSDELTVLRVPSRMECAAECVKRNCGGFSFYLLSVDVGICRLTMLDNVALQPLEGAEYYVNQ